MVEVLIGVTYKRSDTLMGLFDSIGRAPVISVCMYCFSILAHLL